MIKIVHIADLHLDSPFAGSGISEREEKRNELLGAFSQVCKICRDENIDLLLIAGDFFDGDFIRRETADFLSQKFEEMNNTRIFIAPGNHDPYNSDSPYKSTKFPSNVHIFTTETLEAVDIPELNTVVYGYGFVGEKMHEKPTLGINPKDKTKINILVGHADVDVPLSQYYNINGSDLAASGLEYAALGHIHKFGGINIYGNTACAYSGCLMGRDFGECGSKGIIVGEIKKNNVNLNFRTVSESLYEDITVNITDMNLSQTITSIVEKCNMLSEKTSVRITLCGTAKEKLYITPSLFNGLLPKFKLFEINDSTKLAPKIEELLSEHSLRGEFARKVQPFLESDDSYTSEKAALALKYGLEALKG